MPAALITGASSGIGRALALEFARHGHDLILLGRDEHALSAVAEECRERGAPRADCLRVDLSRAGAAREVEAGLGRLGLTVDTLVNNAGIGVHGPFSQTALERELELVHGQVDAMLGLTKICLPGMIERRAGRLLNVASVYSFTPVPEQAVYGASKAFLFSFSESLSHELKESGVTVSVLCPGSTRTEFRSRAGVVRARKKPENSSGMDPEAVARVGYAAAMRGQFLAVPGLHNAAFTRVMRHLPHGLRARIMQFINARRGLNRKRASSSPELTSER